MSASATVLSVGHSDHPIDRLLDLLVSAGASTIVDVRSTPHSVRFPWFDRDALRASAASRGIAYVHRVALGGRPRATGCYADGVADYVAMARVPAFVDAVRDLAADASRGLQVMLCSERHPATCHRCLLVGRALSGQGVDVVHLDGSGGSLTQAGMEDALLARHRLVPDLVDSREGLVDRAYVLQAKRHAFRG